MGVATIRAGEVATEAASVATAIEVNSVARVGAPTVRETAGPATAIPVARADLVAACPDATAARRAGTSGMSVVADLEEDPSGGGTGTSGAMAGAATAGRSAATVAATVERLATTGAVFVTHASPAGAAGEADPGTTGVAVAQVPVTIGADSAGSPVAVRVVTSAADPSGCVATTEADFVRAPAVGTTTSGAGATVGDATIGSASVRSVAVDGTTAAAIAGSVATTEVGTVNPVRVDRDGRIASPKVAPIRLLGCRNLVSTMM